MQLNWPNLTPQFSYFLQIVAVILSTTGIALLAYADGIATTKTLAGVVLAAASAAGSAVYKVFFKRVFGEVSFCQVAIFFSSIGLCSLLTLWTIFLALHLTGQGNFCFFSLSLTYFLTKDHGLQTGRLQIPKRLKDISTPDFSTPSFNPESFNPTFQPQTFQP